MALHSFQIFSSSCHFESQSGMRDAKKGGISLYDRRLSWDKEKFTCNKKNNMLLGLNRLFMN